MTDYGIKVSQPGIDVFSATPQELVFSSKYKTLKIHAQGNGTITDSSRTVTISHNLGYPPFFLVHTQIDPAVATAALVGDQTDYFISPFRLGAAVDIYEAENTHDVIAWADSTNLYIKARENVGKFIYPVSGYNIGSHNRNECMANQDGGGYDYGFWEVGNDSVDGWNNGALRFGPSGITLTQGQSIYNATLNMYVGGRNGSGEVRMNVYGIDEDDVQAFDAFGAFSNPLTSASVSSNSTLSQGSSLGVNVTSIVQEIVNRAGWTSGNQIGFNMLDNSTPSGNGTYYEDSLSGDPQSDLTIMTSSNLVGYKYTIFLNQLE